MKTLAATLVALACAFGSTAWAHEAGEAKEAEQTIQGELVDLACYLEHGGHGEKHKACATSCAQSGLPIGLVDKNGNIYLLIGDHKPLNAQLADKMGNTVKATGTVSSRGGMKLMEASKVE
jgi:hypothetical protein